MLYDINTRSSWKKQANTSYSAHHVVANAWRHSQQVAGAPWRELVEWPPGPARPQPPRLHHPLRRARAGHLRRVQHREALAARRRVPVRPRQPAGQRGLAQRRQLHRHQVRVCDVGPARARGVPIPTAAVAAGGVEPGVQLDGVRRGGHRRGRGGAREARHRRGVARHDGEPGVCQRLRLYACVRRAGAGLRGGREPVRRGAPGLPVRVHVQQRKLQVQPDQRQRPGSRGGQEANGVVQGRGDEHHHHRPQPRRVAGHVQCRRHRVQRRQQPGELLPAAVPGDGHRVREPARGGRQLQGGLRFVPGPEGPPREERRRRRAAVPAAGVRGRGGAAAHQHGPVALPAPAGHGGDSSRPRVLPARRGRRAGQRRRVQPGGGARRGAGEQGPRRAQGRVPGAGALAGAQEQGHGQGRRWPLDATGLRANLMLRPLAGWLGHVCLITPRILYACVTA